MNDKPAMANTQAFAVITQDELSSLRAELAEANAVNREMSDVPDGTFRHMYAITKVKLSNAEHELAELRAQVPELECYSKSHQGWRACGHPESCSNEKRYIYARPVPPAAVPDDVAKDAMLIYEKALVKLATLGNEPLLGNSSGNVIAQDALAQAAAILAAKENKP